MDTGLSNLKRPELQRLAKQHGIKANQKVICALICFFNCYV